MDLLPCVRRGGGGRGSFFLIEFFISTKFERTSEIHTAVRDYMCFKCEKTFTSASCLKLHKRIHTGEKPYHCTVCGKLFNHSSALHKHTKYNHSK